MALSADPAARRYTYADLETFPDDHLRREIIDGELIVTTSPIPRHQKAVMNIGFHLESYARRLGGHAFPAPLDVFFADDNVVEPDVLFIRAEHAERVGDKFVKGAPDLVVEISSPSTRRLELVRKKDLYQRFGIPEYWYVDLEAERVEMYRLEEGAYAAPDIRYPGQALSSAALTGFTMPVDEALGVKP
jgi:Uma2 family endonuclease